MKRDQRRSLDILPVVKLTNAVRNDETVAIYTTHPIKRVAPCLEIYPDGDAPPVWNGFVAVLPLNAPYTTVDSPEIAAGLAIIASSEKTSINILRGLEFTIEWSFNSHFRPPFTSINLKYLDRVIDQIKYDLSNAKLCPQKIRRKIDATHKKLTKSLNADIPWRPVELLSEVNTHKIYDNWELLRHWHKWTNERCDLTELHRRFNETIFPEGEHTRKFFKIKKSGMKTFPQSKTSLDAFKKRLSYLGLPASDKALNPEAKPSKHARRLKRLLTQDL